MIKLLQFLNEANESLKNGLQPQLIGHNASVNAKAPNQLLMVSVNGP